MKEKVLVVEDEAIVQLDIRNRLISLGYEIVGATAYGEDAIKKVSSDCPDIVLLDIGLKGKIDGIETATRIKTMHNVPIVFMTANSDYTTLQKAKITSPFGYILKPFDEREMRTTIEMALYKHKLDSEMNETRHWLETILNSIHDAVVSINSQLSITFMNPAAEAMIGWKASEAQGKNLHDVIHVIDLETRQNVECPVAKVMETGTTCTSKGMMAMVSRNNSECPVDCTVSPILDNKGKIDGIVFIFRDVSEKHIAMEALRISESRLKSALSLAHMGNWDIDLVKNSVWFSDESNRIFGIKPEETELTLDYIWSAVLPEDLETINKKLNQLLPDTRSTTLDFRILRPDGEVRYLHDEVEFLWDKQGNITRLFGTAQDVTRQVLIEQALRESEEKFSEAFQYNPLPMTISRFEDGLFVDVNRRFTEVFGYASEEAIGKASVELGIISGGDRNWVVDQITRHGRIINARINFHAKDGSIPEGLVSYDQILIGGQKHLLTIFNNTDMLKQV